MTDDLVKRLQELAAQSNDGCLRGPALQAANRIEALEAERDRLREAGQAVVDRWDTPLWEEAEATGHVINRLRAALKGDQT